MAKTLDFNALRRPTLPLVMRDADKTQIKVTTPNEGLIEELQAVGPELQGIVSAGDADGIRAIYGLAARLISCNEEGLTVTAEDLRDKYRLGLFELISFFSVYTDFIGDITKAKN